MSTVSVIVVTHNSAATVRACLRSVAAALPTVPYEIFVVDTESSDATISIVQAEARTLRIAVLRAPNRGFGSAANTGAAQATGDVLWFLNPDAVVPPGSGDRLSQLLQTPRVVAAAGVLTDASGGVAEMFGEPFPSLQWYVRRRFGAWGMGYPPTRIGDSRGNPGHPPTRIGDSRGNPGHPPSSSLRQGFGRQARLRRAGGAWRCVQGLSTNTQAPISVPWLSAASLLVRASAFRAVGGFSEQYFLYYEDVDFSRRLRTAGGVLLINPAVRIQHAGGQSATTTERLRASDMAEDRYFAEYRPLWERALLRMFRPLLRVRWGALLPAALVCGALFSVPSIPRFVAVFGGMLAVGSAVVRVPDLGAQLLLFSLLIGQIIRLPLGTTAALTATDLLLPLVVGAWLVRAAQSSRPRSQRRILWSMLLPLLALLPGLLLATERLPVRDWVNAAAYAARLLLLMLLVPLGAHVLQHPRRLTLALVGITTVLALLGVVQWRVFPSTTEFQSAIATWLPLRAVSVQGWDPHVGRLFSTWLDPNLLGGMLVLGVAVLQALPLPKSIVARLAALGGGSLIIAALVLTKSRTAFLALGIVLAASVVVARPWRRLFVLTAGLALGLILTPSVVSRLATVTRLDPTALLRSYAGQDPTTALRVRSWQQALEQTQRAPVFGLGYNAYGIEQRAVGNIQTTQLHSWAGADSSPLTLLATAGIWGAMLFSLVLGAAAWALLRRCLGTHTLVRAPSWVARAAFLGLVGLFAHAQFVQSLLSVQLAVPLALLLAAAFAERTTQHTNAPST